MAHLLAHVSTKNKCFTQKLIQEENQVSSFSSNTVHIPCATSNAVTTES